MGAIRPVFEDIRRDYLNRLTEIWDEIPCGQLGVTRRGECIVVPFYGREYEISKKEITGSSDGLFGHAVSVVLANYLLGPLKKPAVHKGPWTAFREFADSAPFRHGFEETVERKLARQFSGKKRELAVNCGNLGGEQPEPGYSYDVANILPALPKVPVLLLFNDAEEGFPAGCSLLYPANADCYLDMECLVILGTCLPSLLNAGPQAA